MIKRLLVAAAIMIATPGFAFSQDFFWSFQNDANESTAIGSAGMTGSAFIWAADGYGFNAADLNFTSSDPSVLQFTGGVGIDAPNTLLGQDRFNSTDITVNSSADGRWFAVAISGVTGVNPSLQAFDPNQTAGLGSLLAQVDYSIVGSGVSDLELTLGTQDVLLGDGSVVIDSAAVSFGSATFVSLPEPSSAILLILGSVGLIGRRRRAK